MTGYIYCQCGHLSVFGGDFFAQPNKIDFQKVFDNFGTIGDTGNYLVLTIVCSVLGLYLIGVFFTKRTDFKDRRKVCLI